MKMRSSFFVSLLVIGGIVGATSTAHAIPAFARRYGTSCQTCHIAFPKLTPFGEAFRRNGFAFPGQDEEFVKQDQIPLGQEAYRQMFPNAVWPGVLPASPPLAIGFNGAASHPPHQVVEQRPGRQRRDRHVAEPRRGSSPLGGRRLQRAHRLLRRGDVRRRRHRHRARGAALQRPRPLASPRESLRRPRRSQLDQLRAALELHRGQHHAGALGRRALRRRSRQHRSSRWASTTSWS